MKNNLSKGILLFLGISLFLCSCSSRKNILFNTKNEGKIPALPIHELAQGKDSVNLKTQIIKPGDILSIKNIQNIELISGINNQNSSLLNSQNNLMGYRVENDNYVALPVLGKVKLGGYSRENAEKILNELYSQTLLKDPIITITISNLQVTLLGEFVKQGNYNLEKDQIHLAQILGEAGGLNPRADKKRIKIIRGDLTDPQVFIVNLEDINSLADKRLYLQNNDIIYAEPRGAFKFLDQINPTTTILGIGLSVVNIYLLISNLSK